MEIFLHELLFDAARRALERLFPLQGLILFQNLVEQRPCQDPVLNAPLNGYDRLRVLLQQRLVESSLRVPRMRSLPFLAGLEGPRVDRRGLVVVLVASLLFLSLRGSGGGCFLLGRGLGLGLCLGRRFRVFCLRTCLHDFLLLLLLVLVFLVIFFVLLLLVCFFLILTALFLLLWGSAFPVSVFLIEEVSLLPLLGHKFIIRITPHCFFELSTKVEDKEETQSDADATKLRNSCRLVDENRNYRKSKTGASPVSINSVENAVLIHAE
mmetsp:Transcript_9630/g.18722  ORF Transcript_9630/g.18722 Transcript_9630/m.18722 type:complete len:267 (+) Transcript_9630:1246-2046(+)